LKLNRSLPVLEYSRNYYKKIPDEEPLVVRSKNTAGELFMYSLFLNRSPHECLW